MTQLSRYPYVLERDKSPSFEHPTVLYTGKDTKKADSNSGEFVNSDEYQYYYRAKVVTPFGESEWKTGNAISFCNPEEIVELYNGIPTEPFFDLTTRCAYHRIYVPPGVSCIRVEFNVRNEVPIRAYMRYQYLPTEDKYDAFEGEKSTDMMLCTAQVDGKYGYWYIALYASNSGIGPGGKTTATTYDNCSIPYTPRNIEVTSGYNYDGSPSVSWSAVVNAKSYILEIASDDTFKDPRTAYSGGGTYLWLWCRYSGDLFGQGMISKQYFCRVKAVNGNFSSDWRTADEPVTASREDVKVLQNNVEAELLAYHDFADYFLLEVPHGARNLKIIVKSSRYRRGILSARYQSWPCKYKYDYMDDEAKELPDDSHEWELDFSCSGKHGFWYFSFYDDLIGCSGTITATYTGDCLAPISPANIDYPSTDSDGNFLVTWSNITGVTGYVLERDTKNDFSNPSQVYSGTATSFNQTNLLEGTYYYRIRGDNSCGTGLWRVGHPVAVKSPTPKAPASAFMGNPTQGMAPLTINFTDQSTGTVTAQYWVFGDGQTSLSASPSHTYANAGTYTVQYTVNGPGGYDIETKSNYIVVESPTIPTVSTSDPSSVTLTSAKSGGNVSSDGGTKVTQRGVCYGISAKPDISGNYTTNGSGIGTFISEITGLNPGTTYHVRAYATNSIGTAYGSDKAFTTNTTTPTVTTTAISDISSSTAMSGGHVTDNGGASIIARGVCWSTTQNPITSHSKTNDGNDIGEFASKLQGLSPDTTYYVRAYATNSAGTAYGANVSFKTPYSSSAYVSGSGNCGDKAPCYDSIQKAIDHANTGAAILLVNGSYHESITLNQSKELILQGGWDASFENRIGTTILSNAPKAEKGSIKLQNLTILPE